MAFREILLEPLEGSACCSFSYEINAPLDPAGRIEAHRSSTWPRCTLRRIQKGAADECGSVVPFGPAGWTVTYEDSTRRELICGLDNRSGLRVGGQIEITDSDGSNRKYRIASVKPIQLEDVFAILPRCCWG
jgi:hypothetical protein